MIWENLFLDLTYVETQLGSVFVMVDALLFSLSDSFYESTSIKVDTLDLPGAEFRRRFHCGTWAKTDSRDLLPGRNLAELRIPFDVMTTLVDFQRGWHDSVPVCQPLAGRPTLRP
jgi:hypothetical protein